MYAKLFFDLTLKYMLLLFEKASKDYVFILHSNI